MATVIHSVEVANPYLIALVALLATMAGATISAVTQAITTRSSLRNQQATLQLELDHATQAAIRQERLRVYSRFLVANNTWRLLSLDTFITVNEGLEQPDRQEVFDEYNTAYQELILLAAETVSDLSHKMFIQQHDEMRMAERGENPDRGHAEGIVFPAEVVAAMQDELGVVGGRIFNRADLYPLNEHDLSNS